MSFQNATNLSIRVKPNSPDNVKAFGLPSIEEKGFEAGDFIGSIDDGGYLNCKILTIAPHGMGTHTESIRHIVADGPPVCEIVPLVPIRIRLVTLSPVQLTETSESYSPGESTDLVLTEARLQILVKNLDNSDVIGLMIRSTGDVDKKDADYTGANPPFFTTEAMKYISSRFEHLLVDLPSVDRESDDGQLLNHRSFWNVEAGQTHLRSDCKSQRSITEMIDVPALIKDGDYWCLIAVPNIETDALPSRVLIWK